MDRYDLFNDSYKWYLYELYHRPHYECSPRGMKIKELINVNFTIDPRWPLMSCEHRKTPLKYNAAELIWYYTGNRSAEWIGRYASLWKKVANPDGTCNSAYGHLIFFKTNRDGLTQWDWAKRNLIIDKDTRQALLHFNTPEHQWIGNKDFVCTLYALFYIRNNRLNLHYCLRSQDVIYGTPMDVVWGCVMLTQMLYELKPAYPELQLGHYTHQCLSFHLYERHFELVEKMLNCKWEEDLDKLSFPVFDGLDELRDAVDFEKTRDDAIINKMNSNFWKTICNNLKGE